MFDSLIQTVVTGGHGVRAYEACAREARTRITSEPENAAALTLIMTAAQGVVDAYDDQPLPVNGAEALLEDFRVMVQGLNDAYANGTSDAKFTALNAFSVQLAKLS